MKNRDNITPKMCVYIYNKKNVNIEDQKFTDSYV